MRKKKDEPTTYWRLKEWFPDLDNATHKLFARYVLELQKFNKTINLVSPKSIANADLVHFSDSILASQIIKPDIASDSIADFGSGNGFPGLIFAILYPEVRVILFEADLRKAEFLKHIVLELDLKNVDISVSRVENLPQGAVQTAMCRGFASVSRTLFWTRSNLESGSTIYHLKGDIWAKEMAEVPSQLCSIWDLQLLGQYDLPFGGISYAIVKTTRL